jgi:hypothetical protein
MLTMMPNFFYPTVLLVFVRPALEFALETKKSCTPGRIVSFLQGVLCATFLAQKDYESAIASTVIYFISDMSFNKGFGKTEPWPMVIHHICGTLICLYSLHTQSWKESNEVESYVTRSLILMETTNISFQTSMVFYNEFEYVYIMVPAMLHFFVVRVLCLGYYVHPLNQTTMDYVVKGDATVKFQYFLAFTLWAMQMFWFLIWVFKAFTKEKTD